MYVSSQINARLLVMNFNVNVEKRISKLKTALNNCVKCGTETKY